MAQQCCALRGIPMQRAILNQVNYASGWYLNGCDLNCYRVTPIKRLGYRVIVLRRMGRKPISKHVMKKICPDWPNPPDAILQPPASATIVPCVPVALWVLGTSKHRTPQYHKVEQLLRRRRGCLQRRFSVHNLQP